MGKELNISAILKDKSKGTKLWSPIFGDCELAYICEKELEYAPIRVTKKKFGTAYFEKDGKSHKDGDCVLFPSKQMQSWSKFAWKKGDVLVDGCNNYSIFVEFDKGTGYANVVLDFLCDLGDSLIDYDGGKSSYPTQDWSKVPDEKAKEVISHIEKYLNGKLNLKTLKIEEPKQEFKDGDILHNDETSYSDETIFIAKISDGIIGTYGYLDMPDETIMVRCDTFEESEIDAIRLATEEEKQQLFSALEKVGKRWNQETKTIEDLTKKCEFKPMDWCLMRDIDEVEYHNAITSEWTLCQFSHYINDYKFVAVGGEWHSQCIPYNDSTKHLLGTTDEWKGGEG